MLQKFLRALVIVIKLQIKNCLKYELLPSFDEVKMVRSTSFQGIYMLYMIVCIWIFVVVKNVRKRGGKKF